MKHTQSIRDKIIWFRLLFLPLFSNHTLWITLHVRNSNGKYLSWKMSLSVDLILATKVPQNRLVGACQTNSVDWLETTRCPFVPFKLKKEICFSSKHTHRAICWSVRDFFRYLFIFAINFWIWAFLPEINVINVCTLKYTGARTNEFKKRKRK